MSADLLKRIVADKKAHVAARRAQKPFATLEQEAKAVPLPRDFFAALSARTQNGKTALICEIKKASPSAGVIVADYQPAKIAKIYEGAGAACLSVLTDTPYFQGKDEDLCVARAACALPTLRKDFMIDPYQILESRALGADCVLLIMACLSDAQAQELMDAAQGLALSVLIEAHDEAELARALALKSGSRTLIGINNRNLNTLEVDLATTECLAAKAPKDRLLVSESGIKTRADIERLQKSGVKCFLVGENLLKSPNIGAAIKTLLG